MQLLEHQHMPCVFGAHRSLKLLGGKLTEVLAVSEGRIFAPPFMSTPTKTPVASGLGTDGTYVAPRHGPRTRGSKVLFVMVGLPARGKSYIAKKLIRFRSMFSFICYVDLRVLIITGATDFHL